MAKNCLCGSSEYISFSCSGASDLGQVSDLVARKLRDDGTRKMNCLAMVAAAYQKSIDDFKTMNILAIDGCPLDCAKKILVRNGITEFAHLRLTDLGYEKGKTGTSPEIVNAIVTHAQTISEVTTYS